MKHALAVCVLLVGCGSNGSDTAHRDPGLEPVVASPTDLAPNPNGAVSGTYPAFSPSVPQIASLGGRILTSPRLISITYPGDPLAGDVDKFVAKLGGSDYFTAATSEYGIAAATSGTPIHLTESAPTGIDDAQIQSWISSKFQGTNPEWGMPDPNTVYIIHYPSGTTVTLNHGSSCRDFSGYHSSVNLPGGAALAYAVIPRCPVGQIGGTAVTTLLDVVTAAGSHEIIESIEDPEPMSAPGYRTFDANHLPWVMLGGEAGDLCAQEPESFFKPDSLGYAVQGCWSNKAASAFHNPCSPTSSGSYFNSALVTTADVDFDLVMNTGAPMPTKGFKIAAGQSETIEVDLFSDAPTSGPWTLHASDVMTLLSGTPSNLGFSFDRDSGQNGEKLYLTVKVLGPSANGFELFLVTSHLGGTMHEWFGMIEVD